MCCNSAPVSVAFAALLLSILVPEISQETFAAHRILHALQPAFISLQDKAGHGLRLICQLVSQRVMHWSCLHCVTD